MSWSGLCGDCGDDELVSNVRQMHARSGPNWTLWRRNMAASVGGLLLDDIEAALQTRAD